MSQSKHSPAAGKTPELGSAPPSVPLTVTRRQGLDSTNIDLDTPSQDIDHARVRDTGIALSDVRGIETEAPLGSLKQVLAEEKFMQDVLEVQLADPGDENEHQFAEITVNGERVCVKRGDSAQMKRSHVAVLAAAKVQRVVQKKVTASDGSMGYEEKYVLRPVYPFQVMYDPAGQVGNKWLRQILQSA